MFNERAVWIIRSYLYRNVSAKFYLLVYSLFANAFNSKSELRRKVSKGINLET